MTLDLLYRYLHFLGILLASGALFAELLLLRRRLTGLEIKRVGLIDGAYGASILLLVGGGLAQWFVGFKPADFYTRNPVFLVKIGMVALIGLLSIYPTVWLIRNRRLPEAETFSVPGGVRILVRLEAVLLLVVPLLAVLMARGVGLKP